MIRPEVIRARRKRLNLSQDALGELVGVDQKTISDWEAGNGNPTSNSIEKLADALDTSADFLLGRTDDPTPPKPKVRGELVNKERLVIELWREGRIAEAASVMLNDLIPNHS